MEEKKVFCAECGEEFDISEMHEINGEFVCEDCFDTEYTSCADCGEIVHKDDAYYVENHGWVCLDCRRYGDYYYCNHCGDLFMERDICWDSDDDPYCRECCDNGWGDFSVISSYHTHKNNEDPTFFGGDEDDSENLFMGFELEIDAREPKSNDTHASAVMEMFPENFIYMENDCSLDYGFENISQPATLEFHHSMASNYLNAFKYYTDAGYVSHNKNTCGLHIHFNRGFFGGNEEECVTRLCFLFEKFWDNFVKFSRRNESQLNRWAKRYSDAHDEIYKKSEDGSYDRYYAVNLTNENTIEIRMFRGTLRFESFMATLEMVDTIARLAKYSNIDTLRSMKWEELLVTDTLKSYWETVKNR